MTQTKALVLIHLLADTANIVMGYFLAASKDPYEMGLLGNYELCSFLFDLKSATRAFNGACAGGWIEIIKCLRLNGVIDNKKGIHAAAKNGQLEVIKFEEAKLIPSINFFPSIYKSSLLKGHVNIVNIVISGIVPFHSTKIEEHNIIINAYRCGHQNVIEFMKNLHSSPEKTIYHKLLEACRYGDVKIMEQLFSVQEICDDTIEDCFELACSIGNVNVLNFLIAKSITSVGHSRLRGGLIAASKYGHVAVIKILLSLRIFPHYFNLGLLEALKSNHFECVQLLFRDTLCALRHAYSSGQTELVKFVLENSTVNNHIDHVVVTHENIESTVLLFDFLRSQNLLDRINIEGSLQSISRFGNVNLLKLIVDLSKELQTSIDWDLQFMKACRFGNLEYVKAIIELGEISTLHQGINFARMNGHFELSEYLETLSNRRKRHHT
jgi:ankyrin repeat protein